MLKAAADLVADVVDAGSPPSTTTSVPRALLPDVILEPDFQVRAGGAGFQLVKPKVDYRRMTPDPNAGFVVVKEFTTEAAAKDYRDNGLAPLQIPNMPTALPKIRIAKRMLNERVLYDPIGRTAPEPSAPPPAGSIDFRGDLDAKSIQADVEAMLDSVPRFARLRQSTRPDGSTRYGLGMMFIPGPSPEYRAGGSTRPPPALLGGGTVATMPPAQVFLNPVGAKSRFSLASSFAHELVHVEQTEVSGFWPHHAGNLITEEEFALICLCDEYESFLGQSAFDFAAAALLGQPVVDYVRGLHESPLSTTPPSGPDPSGEKAKAARRSIVEAYLSGIRETYRDSAARPPAAYAPAAIQLWRQRPVEPVGPGSGCLEGLMTQRSVWVEAGLVLGP